MSSSTKKIFIAIGDYLVMTASLYLVLLIRYNVDFTTALFWSHARLFYLVFLVWLVVFYSWDLYSFKVRWSTGNFFFSMIMNLILGFSYFYIVQTDLAPKTNLLLVAVLTFLLILLWRFLVRQLVRSLTRIEKVLLLGADSHSTALAETLLKNQRMGFALAGILVDSPSGLKELVKKYPVKVLASPKEIFSFTEEQDVSTVIIGEGWYGKVSKELYELIPLGINFYNISSFLEEFEQKIPIYATNEIWFLENLKNVSRGLTDGFKRMTDVAFAVILAPFVLVLGLITALLVKLSSKGPAFYSQIRVGMDGVDFRIYKFRSMYIDAEKQGAQWSKKNDPRITPVGRFIRSTRLDELPQLLNVLRGDMSFVGPRPERPEFVKELTKVIPHYRLRHLVRPGLTGWAQINYDYGSSVEDAARKLEYDLYYLKNRGTLLDIKIALKTVMVVFSRKGR